MPRIVIPDDEAPVMASSRAYRQLLDRTRADYRVDYHDTLPADEERLIERIAGAEIVIKFAPRCCSARTFSPSPELKLLSLWGTGTDNVDLAAAARHGVTVTNTPGVSALSIAEHALTLLLAVARHIPRIDADVRQGLWPGGQATQMHGKTLGIVGLGAVGREFAVSARASACA